MATGGDDGSEGFTDDDKEYVRRVVQGGEVLQRELRHIVENSDLFNPATSSNRSRVKSYPSILDKVRRKRKDDPTYSVRHVTDVVGFRFITLFRDDIPSVVEDIFALISPQGRLKDSALREFIQYRLDPPPEFDPETDQWFDPIKSYLEDVHRKAFGDGAKPSLVVNRKAGYSSVHIVFTRKQFVDRTAIEVPVEIQVRSVFEEAWCEIDHKLFYEDDREGKESGEKKRSAVRLHLGVLKQLLDAAANYSRVIGELPTRNFRPPDIKENLDIDASYARSLCDLAEIGSELSDMLVELVEEKAKLDELARDKNLRPSVDYIFLGDKISSYLDRLSAVVSKDTTAAQEGLVYLVRLEASICFLLSNVQQQVVRAIAMYRDIVRDYPDHPTAWFRLAQACAHRAADLVERAKAEPPEARQLADEAFEAYSTAERLVKALPAIGRDLIISAAQESYIRQNVARLQSFVRWHISYIRRDAGSKPVAQDVADMLEALMVAKTGLEEKFDAATRFRLVNSAAYYALEALDLSRQLELERPAAVSSDDLEALVAEVEQYCVANDSQFFNAWHTVLRGCLFLGKKGRALAAAKRIIALDGRVGENGLSEYDTRMRGVALREAYRMIEPLIPNETSD